MRLFLIILLLCLIANSAIGQSTKTRCRWLKQIDRPILLDTLSAIPNSFTFPNNDGLAFNYDINTGKISIENGKRIDSLFICYEVFPFSLHKTYFRRDLKIYDSNAFFTEKKERQELLLTNREELFTSPGLDKSGSISRGISFGNNQNVFVNSALNLQLEGKLTDEIGIRASISDQNVPFQPDGNTQQLQEFDNVSIQLYHEKGALTVGDVVFKNQPSQFLRYYRNVQGGLLNLNYALGTKTKAKTSVGAAVAKGKFASDVLDVQDGVLGPYQIRGPNNERFIIILANSEKVYLDGKLLERGFNYDYVIDYNLSEITFTNQTLITKFSRVRVDFEYSDRNYSRTVLTGSHFQQTGKLEFFVNGYSERDNPNRPLLFDLNREEELAFVDAGDQVPLMIPDQGDSLVFSENVILYKKVDTTVEAQNFKIFKFSTNPDSAFLSVSFADLGPGNGNYIQKNTTVNGRVYEWVAPISGQTQGRFEPVKVIPAPTKKQMITIGTAYTFDKVGRIYSEFAFSENDINLFSTQDAADDTGFAFKVGFEGEEKEIGFLKDYKFKLTADYENDDKNFQGLDRFRYIEFDRDWSFDPIKDSARTADQIINVSAQVRKNELNKVFYRWTNRQRGSQVDGNQHHVDLLQQIGRIRLNANLFAMTNDQGSIASNWHRINADIQWNSKYFVPGYHYSTDRNEVKRVDNDSIISTAMNFESHRFYLKSNDTLKTTFILDYTTREDKLPINGRLEAANQSQTSNFGINGRLGKNHQINTLLTYRIIDNFFPSDVEPAREETIMGRVNWRGHFFNRLLNANLTYAIGNGRELRREFVFLEVPTGEGTHAWRDSNGDGIQDLNEFFEAINTDERNYIRLLQPTSEFIQAFTNNFNLRFDMKFPIKWLKEGGIKRFLYRFSNNTNINFLQKFTDDELTTRIGSFLVDIPDDKLLSTRESIRSTLFFNRAQPRYGMELNYTENGRKQLLTNGFESIIDQVLSLNFRYNIKRKWDFKLLMLKGEKSNQSDFLNDKNFFIEQQSIHPSIAWQPRNNFRFGGGYKYTTRDNVSVSDGEFSNSSEVLLNLRWSKVSKRNIGVNFRLISIEFEGEENSAAGYELLQALRPGSNLTWSINWQQKIAGGLQLSINYEGRKSPERSIVHLGRMQLRALF